MALVLVGSSLTGCGVLRQDASDADRRELGTFVRPSEATRAYTTHGVPATEHLYDKRPHDSD